LLSGFDLLPRRILSDVKCLRCLKRPDEGNYRSCRRDAPQEQQAFDIVDEVRQSDLRLRSRDNKQEFSRIARVPLSPLNAD
jgi:hypothetical protein